MAKYRLKVLTEDNHSIFVIQKKSFWWWENVWDWNIHNFFFTREEALERINQLNNKPKITYEYPLQ